MGALYEVAPPGLSMLGLWGKGAQVPLPRPTPHSLAQQQKD